MAEYRLWILILLILNLIPSMDTNTINTKSNTSMDTNTINAKSNTDTKTLVNTNQVPMS